MFRKRYWYEDEDTYDLMFFRTRGEPVDPAVVRRRSLEWAVHCARTPETWDGPRANGLTAYDSWIAHLQRDNEIDAEGTAPEGSPDKPYMVHWSVSGQLAEARHYGAEYLRRVAREEPKMHTELLKAADCYTHIHDLMWKVWNCCGGNTCEPEQFARFAEPDTRARIMKLLQEAKVQDAQAIGHIEAALAAGT